MRSTRHLSAAAAAATAAVLAGCASPLPVPDPPRVDSLMVSDGPGCLVRGDAAGADLGYCQAVRVGSALHVSGVVASGPMDVAIAKAYATLGKVLAANGLAYKDIVKETVYATDLEAFIRNKDRRKAFYGERLPAATWVQVQRLYQPAHVIEVEVTAEAPRTETRP